VVAVSLVGGSKALPGKEAEPVLVALRYACVALYPEVSSKRHHCFTV
jgi:hypothetical protein